MRFPLTFAWPERCAVAIARQVSLRESGGEAMRRPFLALAAGLGILAGCSGTGHSSAAPTSSEVSSTTGLVTTTTDAPNPEVVPQSITPAYVNAVFAVLNHINGNATRELVANGRLTSQAQSDLRAVYNDPLYGQEVRIAKQGLSGGFANVRHPPGDIVTTVVDLETAGPGCIFVETKSDFTAVLVRPTSPVPSEYWVLRPKHPGDDPGHINPTPWALAFNAVYLTPTTIPDQCTVG